MQLDALGHCEGEKGREKLVSEARDVMFPFENATGSFAVISSHLRVAASHQGLGLPALISLKSADL